MTHIFSPRPTAKNAETVLDFWFVETKPYQWYRRDRAFDETVRNRFGRLREAACQGRLDVWRAHSSHALALIILIDQFSRNIDRDEPQAFTHDHLALDAAREAVRRRFDGLYEPRRRCFFYMPFMHAEDLEAQNECVRLFKARLPATSNLRYAIIHRDIIARFGRFPHRNRVLGRTSTPEEIAFLRAGGFNP